MNLHAPIKNIPDDWITEAIQALQKFASTASSFSGNDLWDSGLSDPGNRRALGILIVRARNEGLLAEAGADVSVGGHGQRISRWVGSGDWAVEVAA